MSIETMTVQHGETVNRVKDISTESQTVRMFNVSKNDKTGQNYKVNWTFDFSDCTEAEILDLAGRSAVIAYRKHFRGVGEEQIPEYAELVINVHDDVIASERTKKSPTEQAKRLLASMTSEQRDAVLAELGL